MSAVVHIPSKQFKMSNREQFLCDPERRPLAPPDTPFAELLVNQHNLFSLRLGFVRETSFETAEAAAII